jgi:hypothetical protein
LKKLSPVLVGKPRHCSCRCHGQKTERELGDAARQARAATRVQKVLDEGLERHTPENVLRLAAEDDE